MNDRRRVLDGGRANLAPPIGIRQCLFNGTLRLVHYAILTIARGLSSDVSSFACTWKPRTLPPIYTKKIKE